MAGIFEGYRDRRTICVRLKLGWIGGGKSQVDRYLTLALTLTLARINFGTVRTTLIITYPCHSPWYKQAGRRRQSLLTSASTEATDQRHSGDRKFQCRLGDDSSGRVPDTEGGQIFYVGGMHDRRISLHQISFIFTTKSSKARQGDSNRAAQQSATALLEAVPSEAATTTRPPQR